MSPVSRRKLLRTGLATGAGALMGASPAFAADMSRVVVARSDKVFAGERKLDPKVTQELVDAAVARLTGEADGTRAWKALIRPADVVGIKVNCLAGLRLSTRIEVVRAVADGCRRAGVPARRIIVWDRKKGDLARAAYPLGERDEFVCIGNDHPRYGFGGRIIIQGVIGSLFSALVTQHCTAIINLPVLKDHDLAGVTVAMKSFFGAIHNPNKYHFGDLQQAIVDVNCVPVLRKKTILHLCDATFGCYHTGPTPRPKFIERLGTLYATRDPVALDYLAWQKIEALRKANGLASLVGSKREPQHIALAAKAGLGTNDPARIELVEV